MAGKRENSSLISFLCCLIIFLLIGLAECTVTKLFVFGDSFVDTGNINNKSVGFYWKPPYGITFPGKPAGRASDGRIFTDYVAKFLGLKSPVPVMTWLTMEPKMQNQTAKSGMNFAYAGTGVFDTVLGTDLPNMTTQIDNFEHFVIRGVISRADLSSSVALVSLGGSDYVPYITGSGKDLPVFIKKVVNQLTVNLRRIRDLGFKKVAVTGLEPLGCLPLFQATHSKSAKQRLSGCNETTNSAFATHRILLQQAVIRLNKEYHHHSPGTDAGNEPVVILDLLTAFMSAFQQKSPYSGKLKFENPLKECCKGTNQNSLCGNVDSKGNKLYSVCANPKAAFFWDSTHPTQAGWEAITLALKGDLQRLYN